MGNGRGFASFTAVRARVPHLLVAIVGWVALPGACRLVLGVGALFVASGFGGWCLCLGSCGG